MGLAVVASLLTEIGLVVRDEGEFVACGAFTTHLVGVNLDDYGVPDAVLLSVVRSNAR
ncbi:hypothetical protein [Mesorhizobium sp.]|uniref:hypothetical protein n=1 Tax=Mesorhizobium sp. TaxID=1871066 RepID=UPI00257D7CC8|nr:hypothetical protein [Mesorhizobium sp.]